MVGRSLFSLLAIAAVAIQSCAANLIPDGRYTIELSGFRAPLSADDVDRGTLLYVFSDGRIKEWDVKTVNGHDLIEIIVFSSTGPRFVAPSEKGIDVVLRDEPFQWRLKQTEDEDGEVGFHLERTNYYEENRVLSLSPYRIFPPRAANVPLGEFRLPQVWAFKPVYNFKQDTNCGPRRLLRDSFYIQ
ncbi:MAG: hypothetical protein J3Q66DRAFT_350278 [Benniella sp.]|nr:MAG: hypothetical protein J3Q66DRAFT_350278 [Benniella sp.]